MFPTAREAAEIKELKGKHLATARAYQMRLVLQDIYRLPEESSARQKLRAWCRWVKMVARKYPTLIFGKMLKAAAMIENHLEGILAHTAFGDPAFAMEQDPVGLALLKNWLKEVRRCVEAAAALTEEILQKLAARFGDKPNTLVLSLEDFLRTQEAEATGDGGAGQEQRKTAALAFLDRRLRSLEVSRARLEEDREFAGEARHAAAVLPSAAVLDKIMRYETKLERQMYRAMAQLERVQRMRGGEAIPAPLSVEVSNRE